MKTVTILSIHSKRQAEDAPFTYTVQVENTANNEEMLDAAFEMTNRSDRPLGDKVCSTSPGDLMQLDDRAYLVEGGGFAMLTKNEFEQIQKLRSRDTGAGLQWLYKYNLLKPITVPEIAA